MNTETVPVMSAKDFKTAVKPIWCPGCGHFAVLSALTKALAWLALPKEDVAVVSGIGCSSRLPAYVDTYGFHGVHGRALPVATGLKAARPDLTVIAAGGDGDGYSIGGNHFLHACRRNMDMLYVVMDNRVYGMTKGQASPTTAPDWANKLAPHGTGVRPFNPLAIALAAGAGFIARGFSGDPKELTRLITRGIEYPGFAFLEVLSPCTTFRPDEKEWKKQVSQSPDEPVSHAPDAAARIYALGEFLTGIVYEADQPPWRPAKGDARTIDEIAAEFVR